MDPQKFLLTLALIAAATVVALWHSRAHAAGGDTVHPTVDINITGVEVVWVDTRATMRTLLERNKLPVNSHSERGFSLRGRHAVTGEPLCIIYAFRPESVNDKPTLVLGHELAHCLLGAYHD